MRWKKDQQAVNYGLSWSDLFLLNFYAHNNGIVEANVWCFVQFLSYLTSVTKQISNFGSKTTPNALAKETNQSQPLGLGKLPMGAVS